MAVIGGLLLAVIVIWRIYKLLEMIWTREGIIGVCFLMYILVDPIVVLFGHRMGVDTIIFYSIPFWIGVFLCIAYYCKWFKNLSSLTRKIYNKLPQKRMNPSKGIIIGGLIVYTLIALLIYGIALLDYQFSPAIKNYFTTYMLMIGFFLLLSIICKPCRVSMALLANVALLGLLTYHIESGSSGMDANGVDTVPADACVIDDNAISLDGSGIAINPNVDIADVSKTDMYSDQTENSSLSAINITGVSTNVAATDTPMAADMNSVPKFQAVTIQDANDFTVEHINPVSETRATVTDNMGMIQGDMTQNVMTGDVTLHDSAGLSVGSVTSTGIIQGIDGLADGRLIHMENGATVIQDDVGRTLAYVNQQGVITGPDGMKIGRIK